jgi:metal-responsive CopG/Arc/MetJ family transcriptional regulator
MTAVMESVNLGVRFPRETLNKLDQYKGYHSRNRFLVKIVDEYLASQEEELAQAIASGERGNKRK